MRKPTCPSFPPPSLSFSLFLPPPSLPPTFPPSLLPSLPLPLPPSLPPSLSPPPAPPPPSFPPSFPPSHPPSFCPSSLTRSPPPAPHRPFHAEWVGGGSVCPPPPPSALGSRPRTEAGVQGAARRAPLRQDSAQTDLKPRRGAREGPCAGGGW